MSDYINYPLGTMVIVRDTGQVGEAFESFGGFISVFIEGYDECSYFSIDEVDFL